MSRLSPVQSHTPDLPVYSEPWRDIVKDSCDRSRIFPGPDNIPGGTLSQHRIDGIDQNGFACAGFTGKDIEPLGKVDIRFLDNCNILDVKLGNASGSPLYFRLIL